MDLESELRQFVVEQLLDGTATDLSSSEALLATGRIDSLGLIRLLSHVQQRFKVDLMATGAPEDFESIDSLAAAVRRQLP